MQAPIGHLVPLGDRAILVWGDLPARSRTIGLPKSNKCPQLLEPDAFLSLNEELARLEEALPLPDFNRYASLLRQCCEHRALSHGRRLHEHMVVTGGLRNLVLGNLLVQMYGKCGSLEDARIVFNGLPERNVFSWTILIAAYAQNGHFRGALKVFREMDRDGVEPNDITFTTLLGVLSSRGHLAEGKALHARIRSSVFHSHVQVNTAVINMYGKCGSPDDARITFDLMRQRSVVSWNAMISAYAQNGHIKEALGIYHMMNELDVEPNEITFINVLTACCSPEDLPEGKAIHASILLRRYESEVKVGTALVNMYGKCGSLPDAKSSFERMRVRNEVSWNAIIAAYAQKEHGLEALWFFKRMNLEGVKPSNITFASVLDACSSVGALAEGTRIHALIGATNDCESDIVVWTALLNMYGKCGSLVDARRVFERMRYRNVFSWNTLMAAHAQQGHGDEVLVIYNLMQQEGVKPNPVTFVYVLYVCSHAGLLSEGFQHFLSMEQDHGIAADAEHYGCMIDLLGRAGWLKEAEEVIRKMPSQDAVAWLALLGGCRMHDDARRGVQAAERVFSMELGDAGPYVLLSNIYAANGSWSEAREAAESGSAPSWSSIEVSNRVQEFVAGGTLHLQAEEIHAELKRLQLLVNEAGHLHKQHEEDEGDEKEQGAGYHSERLAIAYGLINMPSETPIRVFQNHRVCSDCHSFTKLISKAVGREITIKDSSRFHRFKAGICSCGDYW